MIRRIFLLTIGLLLLTGLACGIWLSSQLNQAGPLEQQKIVIIAPGSSINIIAKMLKQNNVIADEQIFAILARIYSYDTPLKSGEYEFTKGAKLKEVIEILQAGKSVARKITIPEGLAVKQILDIVNDEKLLKGAFIVDDIDEGSLLPSTYHFAYGDKKQEVIRNMQNAHLQIMSELLSQHEIPSPLNSKKEVLILASIVEKEAPNDAERPLIAGVFLNRLKAGMRLQADPTVLYTITNGRYNLGRLLTKKDLQYESPYNTYLVRGLPPSPICCPGEKSIEAVLNPAETDAYYFVVNGDGGHSFAKNLNEHLKNVKKYRKIQKKMRRSKAIKTQGANGN